MAQVQGPQFNSTNQIPTDLSTYLTTHPIAADTQRQAPPPGSSTRAEPYLSASSISSSDDDSNNNHNHHDSDVEQEVSEDIIKQELEDVGGSGGVPLVFKFDDLHEPHTLTLRELTKDIECVDCREIPMAEIFSCTSGHIICNKCMKIDYLCCSVCSDPTTDTRNIIAEKIVASFKFKCKNRPLGCKKILSSTDIEKHLNDECAFRPVPCLVDDDGKGLCNGQLIPFEKYAAHVKDRHSPLEHDNSTSKLLCDSVTKDYTWPLQCISFDGQLFFQHVVYQDSVAYIWISVFGSPNLQKSQNYSATVSLEKTSEPNQKNMQVWSKISVQHFRKPFHEVKAELACMSLSKEEFVVFSSSIMAGEGRETIQDIIVYNYLWMLKTTICKDSTENLSSPVRRAIVSEEARERLTRIESKRRRDKEQRRNQERKDEKRKKKKRHSRSRS